MYGRANETNFPNVNDYRNIVVAEAMKVLGFVNRHSRGVLKVQKDLVANENGMPIYDFAYQTAVSVRENKSPRGERMTQEAIKNGFMMKSVQSESITATLQKRSQKRSQKGSDMTIFEFPTEIAKKVYEAIKLNRKAKYSWLSDNLGVSESTIKRAINDLKEIGLINTERSKIKGEWQLM